MLPDSQNQPARLLKRLNIFLVPPPIPGELRLPIGGVRAGLMAVLGTAVPEAAVYEDRDLRAGEHYVWPHTAARREIKSQVAPVSQASGVQSRPKSAFRHRVASAIGPHVVATRIGRADSILA